MEYVQPLFTSDEIDEAGRIISLGSGDQLNADWALDVFSNWRASHAYPLNGMSVVLKQRATRIAAERPLISQRLKRIESVQRKLRNRPDDITMSSMQDIGGCRAILGSVAEVEALRNLYLEKTLTHQFKVENNYIERPKKDGYRGVHLVYFFVGSTGRAETYAARRMQIEIQIRTLLQHYWATAVETAETFTGRALKSQRDENTTPWRRFFALVSSCFASQEGAALVPKMTKNMNEVLRELRELEREHRFCESLDAYKLTAEHITRRNKAKYFLLQLDKKTKEITLLGFRAEESTEGAAAYSQSEAQQGSLLEASVAQNVLVSVDDVSQLRRAYPNYYLDTTEFVSRVRAIVG